MLLYTSGGPGPLQGPSKASAYLVKEALDPARSRTGLRTQECVERGTPVLVAEPCIDAARDDQRNDNSEQQYTEIFSKEGSYDHVQIGFLFEICNYQHMNLLTL
ncbi:MAG: hypothetical protein AB7O95_09980 [Geminicoccaceae bacterium]